MPSLIIELAFIWIVVAISFFPVSDSVWILNGAAVIKVLLALIVGGLAIAVVYIFTAFGIGTAIPTKEISSSAGLVDSVQMLLSRITESPLTWFVSLVAILFLLTLFGNMVSWSLGVNSVAQLAAIKGREESTAE